MKIDPDIFSELLAQIHSADSTHSLQLLRQSIQNYPGDARLWVLLAAEYAEAGNIDRAEAAYMVALHCAPDYALARFQLGLLQFTERRPTVAQLTWAKLDELDEQQPLRLFKMGFECLNTGQRDQAIAWLRRGIACNRDNIALNQDMERVLRQISEGLVVHQDISTTIQPDATPSENEKEERSEEHTAHFLISSYRNLH